MVCLICFWIRNTKKKPLALLTFSYRIYSRWRECSTRNANFTTPLFWWIKIEWYRIWLQIEIVLIMHIDVVFIPRHYSFSIQCFDTIEQLICVKETGMLAVAFLVQCFDTIVQLICGTETEILTIKVFCPMLWHNNTPDLCHRNWKTKYSVFCPVLDTIAQLICATETGMLAIANMHVDMCRRRYMISCLLATWVS